MKPSVKAVEAATDCQQAFMANPRNPATWSPRVARIIQTAMDEAAAEMRERCAKVCEPQQICYQRLGVQPGMLVTPPRLLTAEQLAQSIRALPLAKGSE